MTDPLSGQVEIGERRGWDIFEVWKEYEGIAMHFNDLLIKLRSQALAGVAALATVASIFAKLEIKNEHASWEVAAFIFGGLALFWVAIWIIDFHYYNRLLLGAVTALVALEKQSSNCHDVRFINMSTTIENTVAGVPALCSPRSQCERFQLGFGRWIFYILVFLTLIGGLTYSAFMYLAT